METLSLFNWERALLGFLVRTNEFIPKALIAILQDSLRLPWQHREGKRAGTEWIALGISYRLQALEDKGGYIESFEHWPAYYVSLTLMLREWCRA